jgi:hypothetical protein
MTKTRFLVVTFLLLTVGWGYAVIRRDTLLTYPTGFLVPYLVVDNDLEVDGTSIFTGAVTFSAGTDLGTGTISATELATDSVDAAEIVAGAVGTAEIATDGVEAAEIAAGAVATSELATGAVGNADVGAVLMDKIIFCGNSFSSTTGYIGPAATAYLSGGSVDLIMGGTACDAIPESTTETTADEPIAANFPAFKVHGLYCRVSSDPTADVVVAMRSAAAATTPAITCTIAGSGSATHCRALTSSTTDIAAGATVAVAVTTGENLSAQDVWCEMYFSIS